jgi:hypothetical protein
MLNYEKAEFSTRRHIEKLTEALEKRPELDTKTTAADIPLAWISLIAETEEEMGKQTHPEEMRKQWYIAQKEMKKVLRRLYSRADEKEIMVKWEVGDIWPTTKARLLKYGALICLFLFGCTVPSITQLSDLIHGRVDIVPPILTPALLLAIGILCNYRGIRAERGLVNREKEKTEKEILSVMQARG